MSLRTEEEWKIAVLQLLWGDQTQEDPWGCACQVRLWCLARPQSDDEGSDFDDMGGQASGDANFDIFFMRFSSV